MGGVPKVCRQPHQKFKGAFAQCDVLPDCGFKLYWKAVKEKKERGVHGISGGFVLNLSSDFPECARSCRTAQSDSAGPACR